MSRYNLRVCEDVQSLARAAAETVARCIAQTLSQQPRCTVALAGGSTPQATYALLGRERLAWERVDILLGDERWVSLDNEASNARMVHHTLMGCEPAAMACLHPVPTHLASPDVAATAYEALVQSLCTGDPPQLDLVLLGLGDDGHTASLFPGTAAVSVTDRWVTVGMGKGLPRVTMTAPLLSAARQVVFLVAGGGKREALARLLASQGDAARTPARLVAPQREVVILSDRAAAG